MTALKTVFHGHEAHGGVYAITNSVTGWLYFGSTAIFMRRVREHTWHLNVGRHYNKKLQADFNLYGEGAFTFSVVSVHANPAEWERAEEIAIGKVYGEGCYNVLKDPNRAYQGHVASLILKKRRETRIRQRDLGAMLGYDLPSITAQATISGWERGFWAINPTPPQKKTLAKFLDLTEPELGKMLKRDAADRKNWCRRNRRLTAKSGEIASPKEAAVPPVVQSPIPVLAEGRSAVPAPVSGPWRAERSAQVVDRTSPRALLLLALMSEDPHFKGISPTAVLRLMDKLARVEATLHETEQWEGSPGTSRTAG